MNIVALSSPAAVAMRLCSTTSFLTPSGTPILFPTHSFRCTYSGSCRKKLPYRPVEVYERAECCISPVLHYQHLTELLAYTQVRKTLTTPHSPYQLHHTTLTTPPSPHSTHHTPLTTPHSHTLTTPPSPHHTHTLALTHPHTPTHTHPHLLTHTLSHTHSPTSSPTMPAESSRRRAQKDETQQSVRMVARCLHQHFSAPKIAVPSVTRCDEAAKWVGQTVNWPLAKSTLGRVKNSKGRVSKGSYESWIPCFSPVPAPQNPLPVAQGPLPVAQTFFPAPPNPLPPPQNPPPVAQTFWPAHQNSFPVAQTFPPVDQTLSWADQASFPADRASLPPTWDSLLGRQSAPPAPQRPLPDPEEDFATWFDFGSLTEGDVAESGLSGDAGGAVLPRDGDGELLRPEENPSDAVVDPALDPPSDSQWDPDWDPARDLTGETPEQRQQREWEELMRWGLLNFP